MLRKAQARWGKAYVLQGDIARYFPSIDQRRLLKQISKTIKDRRVINLWWRIMRPHGADQIGAPIGALTSQLGANVHLDPMDHHVTDDLGYGLYARYMDDWIIIAPDKHDLWRLLSYLEKWLHYELGLVINPKSTVYPAEQGVDFAGYRTWTTHILPRKKNVAAAKSRMKGLMAGYRAGRVPRETVESSWASFKGYLKHCESAAVRRGVVEDLAA